MLDVLAFKASDFPARNLVTNGDFSNGTTGFGGAYSNRSAANNTLIITGTGSNASVQAWSFDLPYVSGDVYYARARARVTNSAATALRLVSYPDQSLSMSVTPVENQWYDLSARAAYGGETSSSGTRLMITTTYPTAGDASGKVTEVQYMLLLNLTKIFGVGNEPTRDQMDELLTQFPNSWFNGVGNLFNAKHFMGIYFKKITELENAITMLGGGS